MRVTVEVSMEVTPIEVYLKVDGHRIHESICSMVKGAFLRGAIVVGGVKLDRIEVTHHYAESKED